MRDAERLLLWLARSQLARIPLFALQRAKKSLLDVVWDRIRRYLCSIPTPLAAVDDLC
jgi:hypothetical protein